MQPLEEAADTKEETDVRRADTRAQLPRRLGGYAGLAFVGTLRSIAGEMEP